MAKRQAKTIDYQSLESSDLVWLAQVDNDKQALDEIYSRKMVIAVKIARNYCRRYTFVDVDDLSQSMLLALPKIVRTYRPGKATDWDKYCYHRLFYTAKDILRQRDDLGIGWPQKKAYPDWHHLGDEAFEGFHVTDWRAPSEDSIDLEKFFEEIEGWREAFLVARQFKRPKTSAAVHGQPARAWVDDKYYGVHPLPTKQKAVPRGLANWKVQRSKPKQLVMF